MIKWHGRAPSGLGGAGAGWTQADEVNEAVAVLLVQERGYVPAMVLRTEYFLINQPREVKRRKLSRLGLQMGDVRYCQRLRIAKIHVAGWLRLPFSDLLEEEEAISMLEHLVAQE